MMGRPSKYSKEYPKRVLQMMSQGYSIEACAGDLGVAKQTLYNWKDQHPEFLDAIKRGEAASQLFWERAGIEALTRGRSFNATVWIFNMKNRFGWRDKADRVRNPACRLQQPEN